MENIPKEKGENIKCYVRCRPLNDHEKILGIGCIKIDEDRKTICVENKVESSNSTNNNSLNNNNPRFENKNFNLDWVADEIISQEYFFNTVATPILKSFFQGYNCTIFAYGQTGAGKSYTMLGSTESIFEYNSPNHGLIPRIINSIFDQNKNKSFIINPEDDPDNYRDMKFEIKCSCLEIYQEQIIDLLTTSSKENSENLVVREDAKRGMYIDGIREELIINQKNALELIMLGLKNRHQAATFMNAESSRSHLIFTIFLNYSFSNKEGLITTRNSRLHLIDLAGSERQKATRAIGERIKEAGMINKSLSTLGNVINALVEFSDGKTKYVPFRDSKLTFFLKDSLGGNSKTTIIANISQSIIQIQETLSTLKFVQRAKLIKNKAIINENVNATMKILQEEIKKLKDELELTKKLQIESSVNSKKSNNSTASTICDYCLGKNSQGDKSFVETKRESIIMDQTKQMKFLINKIDNLFVLQPQIEVKLKTFDDIYLDEFFENKYKFEKNFSTVIINLNEKVNHFTNILSMYELLFMEIKDSSKHNNNFILEKMQKFLDELKVFKYDFELNNYLDIFKLEEENRCLKYEMEIYKNLSGILQQNKVYSKITSESLGFYNNIIKQFIEVNKDIKEFFKQNLITKNGVKTLKEINLALIDQMTLDKMKFQLEEHRINEDNKMKHIEELESENFLLNMEIMKIKSGENNDRIESETLDLGYSNYNSHFDIADPNEENKINVNNKTNTEKNFNNINQKNINKIDMNSTPNKNRDSIKVANSNGNKNCTKNDFLENLRSSVMHNTSNQNSFRSTKKENLNSPQVLTKENLELLRLKEKLDDALINLEDKNNELSQKNSKIEELELVIENLEENISINNIQIKSLKDELETLYDSNNLLSLDIEKLNSNQEILNNIIDGEIPELINNFDKNDKILNTLSEDYKTDMNGFKAIYNNFFNRYTDLVKKLNNTLIGKNQKIESCEKINKELISIHRDNLWDIFENITFSIKEFEKVIRKKIDGIEIRINKFAEFIEKTKDIIDNKIKKQNNIFQSDIYRRISIILNKVGILSTREDFDELLDKFDVHISGKIFNYLNIDRNKLTKLERKVYDLKEEKKQLNNDLILLRTDFSDALSNLALNNKIALLMKFKEENFKLRQEINQIRKKNDNLEKQLIKIQETNQNFLNLSNPNNLNLKNLIHSENNIASLINSHNANYNLITLNSNLNSSYVSNTSSSDEINKLKKDYYEILEKIFEIDENENTKTLFNRNNFKEKQAFRKALEILNKIGEAKEYDKFFNKISFKNELDLKSNIFESINTINLTHENINSGNNLNRLSSNSFNLNKSIQSSVLNNNFDKSPNKTKEDFYNKTPPKKKEEKLNSTFNGFNKTPKNKLSIPSNQIKPTSNAKMSKTFLIDKKDPLNNKMQKSSNDLNIKKNNFSINK